MLPSRTVTLQDKSRDVSPACLSALLKPTSDACQDGGRMPITLSSSNFRGNYRSQRRSILGGGYVEHCTATFIAVREAHVTSAPYSDGLSHV